MAALGILLALATTDTIAKPADKAKASSETETEAQKENTDSIDFRKSIKEAQVFPGIFDAYLLKDGKLYLSLPDSVFDYTYMLVSRVNGVSETADLVAGEMNVTPIVVRLSKDPYNVYLHIVQRSSTIDPSDPIYSSYERNFTDPIAKGFKIKHREGDRSFIDATSFFCGDEKLISPMKEKSPIEMLLSGAVGVSGSYYDDGSAITEVKSFPDNITIKSRLSYITDKAFKPYTVSVSRIIAKLPDTPMQSRIQDNRVGYFYDVKQQFSSDLDRVKPYQIIDRFRVEPRDEDREAYFAGQLVEPKQKIIFYVDSAFPEKWRPAVKEGVEYWNKAFEAAGFKNAIEARDYPEDPTFDADDITKNCIRYCVTTESNAMGDSYVDPRTGEILGADVIWYHNVVSLVHDWRFAQTAAVDPRVRTKVFADSLMHESLTYVAAHEIGHCLGLMHNMGASYAFTIDNLRDPEFTQKYGTTPSIMDYARNNYVAQPGDLERGVRLTPPPIGVYDIHAINWGYRLFPGINSPWDEKPMLDAIIREHDGDPMYEFGAQQVLGLMDPTDQTEDLSNDLMAAGDNSISNLKLIISNFEDWAGEPDENYEALYSQYQTVVRQYMRHLSHVVPYLGGVIFKEVRQHPGDGNARSYVCKEDQKKALGWLLAQLRDLDWIEPAQLIAKFDDPPTWRPRMERSLVGSLMAPVVLGRMNTGWKLDPSTGYRVEDYLDDCFDEIFATTIAGKPLDSTEINIQSAAIATMARNSGLEALTGVSTGSKALAPEGEADTFKALSESTEQTCTWRGANTLTDETRAFYRFALDENPLPENEMRPLLARQLRKTQHLYRKAMKKTSDVMTREYYAYQLNVLDKLLK